MPKKLIEAALFMSPRPLSVREISKITGISSEDRIEEKLVKLQKEYEGRGIEITKSEEGWAMEVRKEILPKVAHLTPYSDLREGHRRTLALVAYREPIKQSDVVRIQGNKAYAYIKLLVKKGLIKSEKEGRTRILTLTKEFERYFGEEKQRIKDMLEKGAMETSESQEENKEEMTEEIREETESGKGKEGTDSGITEIIPFDEN